MGDTGRHAVNLLLLVRSAGPYLFAFLTLLLGMVGHWLNVERPFTLADGVDAFLGSARYLVFDGFQAPDEACVDTTVACAHPDGAWFVRGAQLSAVFFVIATADQVLRHLGGGFTRLRFNVRAQFGRRLDLVIGMGWHGSTLVETMRRTGDTADAAGPTLCIDLSPSAQATEICRQGRILLLQADADTDELLGAINFSRVARVFLSAGSDATNAAVLRRLAGQVARRPPRATASRRPACFVSVDTFRVFDALLDASVKRTLDIRPFNDAATTARLLCMRQHETYAFTGGVDASRLVLWGDGAMTDALLLHWLQNHVIEAGTRVQVDVVHPQGHAAALRFAAQHPCFRVVAPSHDGAPTVLLPDAVWVDEQVLPTLVFHPAPVAARGQIEWMERYLDAPGAEAARTTVVVALDDLADAVNVSRAIQRTLMVRAGVDVAGPGGIGLWIYLNTRDEVLFAGLDASFQQDGGRAIVFRDHLGEYSKARMTGNVIERAGMWTHAAYSGAQARTPGEIEALWHGAPDPSGRGAQPPADEWARESSRLAGAHAWVKRGIATRLAARGCANQEAVRDELACVEHRRWCAVHLLLGWRPLVGPDPQAWTARERADARAWYAGDKNRFREQRLHLCLMTLAQLDAMGSVDGLGVAAASNERFKDHQIVAANPSILAFATDTAADP